MATVEECRAALTRLATHLSANAAEVRSRVDLDRRLACRITDLGTAFRGRLTGGTIVDLAEGDDPQAQITLSATSDDLIALIDGELDFTRALAGRRISIRASPVDLWRLRRLL